MQLSAFKEWLGPTVSQPLSFLYWNVVQPVVAQPSLHWGFLLSNLAIAWLFFLWTSRREQPVGGSFWSWLFPRAVWRHPSATVDVRFYVVSQLMMAHLRLSTAAVGLVALLHVQDEIIAGLQYIFPAPAAGQRPGLVASALFTLAMGVAFDYGRYLSHRLHHRIPMLWEFHKVHHSAPVLNIFTAYRNHPIEALIELFLRLLATAIVSGVFGFFYPEGVAEATVLSYGFVTFLFYLNAHLRHSSVPMDYGPLREIFVSPLMHHVHHSADQRHFDRNFGFIFSCWDRLGGTLYLPRRGETFDFGLPADAGRFDSVTALFITPFVECWRRVRVSLRKVDPPGR